MEKRRNGENGKEGNISSEKEGYRESGVERERERGDTGGERERELGRG